MRTVAGSTDPRVGRIVAAAGPLVRAADLSELAVGEVVRVGPQHLFGEVINLEPQAATIQVYEETAGLRIGDPVEATGAPLRAWLGPGLLGSTFDGLQRPLAALAAAGAWRPRGGKWRSGSRTNGRSARSGQACTSSGRVSRW